MKTIFVTGIDTDAGKSIATGMLAKYLRSTGVNVITQKLIQTGCEGVSEDIQTHRRLMGVGLLPEDLDGTTCPFVFTYPCSPHLAAEIDNREIDLNLIKKSTLTLESRYDLVLLEGAGGVMVPLSRTYSTVDYIADNSLPVILVTSPKLGSINHTLLSLEVLWSRGVEVFGVVYNRFPNSSPAITNDTLNVVGDFILQKGKAIPIAEMGAVSEDDLVDFRALELKY